jgi:hypothetical protein
MVAEKVRLFIIVICLRSVVGGFGRLCQVRHSGCEQSLGAIPPVESGSPVSGDRAAVASHDVIARRAG